MQGLTITGQCLLQPLIRTSIFLHADGKKGEGEGEGEGGGVLAAGSVTSVIGPLQSDPHIVWVAGHPEVMSSGQGRQKHVELLLADGCLFRRDLDSRSRAGHLTARTPPPPPSRLLKTNLALHTDPILKMAQAQSLPGMRQLDTGQLDTRQLDTRAIQLDTQTIRHPGNTIRHPDN